MVAVVEPEFVPAASLNHEEMTALQQEIADCAVFGDDFPFDPDDVAVADPFDLTAGVPEPVSRTEGETLDTTAPIVVGIDQAFLEARALSAVVAIQDGVVIERQYALTPLEVPYIPGLLAFREGQPILEALEQLSVTPDLLVFDGSGRLHYRQAGIATHVGVTCDVPSIGVAKSQLCGTLDEDPTTLDARPAGWSTPIRANDEVEAPPDTIIGYAYQSRQYDNSTRINPLYVSPGHRISAATTLTLVSALCGGYKLPAPIRLADAYAATVKQQVVDREDS